MIRLRPALLSVSLLALAAACGGTVAQPEPTSSASAAEATRAPVAVQAHGLVRTMGAALADVPLRPAQRTEIEKLASDAEARHAQGAQARRDMMTAVAAQVEQGKIDRAALQPQIDGVTVAMQSSRPADRAALERLHAILDPDQRVAFVNALEAKMQEMRGEHGDHDHGAAPGRAAMRDWARELNLTDDQKTQIHDAMRARFAHAHDEGEAHEHHAAGGEHQGAAWLQAFKGDRFVMDEVSPAGNLAGRAQAMEDHFLGMVETVVPILTPEQRTIAAQKIPARAAAGEGDDH